LFNKKKKKKKKKEDDDGQEAGGGISLLISPLNIFLSFSEFPYFSHQLIWEFFVVGCLSLKIKQLNG